MNKKRINDRYEIIRPIGGGGMADVYLANDLILDRHVAVKMLKTQFSNDEEFIRRFRREAQSATSLSHPNVVNIYDVGEEEDLYYIVMEYVEGQTLKDYIQQRNKLSVQETVKILEQIASAVSHAHDNHIVHRDIKPQNIMIGKGGIAKVTDFGIARAISEATITHTNSVLGSVHYLSPEQARGGHVTYKSDLYSLGIITYEMLTGVVPFTGDTAVSVAIKHLQEPLPLLRDKDPSIPQSIENLVMKATAKDPMDRYFSSAEIIADLSTILHPNRQYESRTFIPTPDEEMTKAIPIVNNKASNDYEQTMVHPYNKEHPSSDQNNDQNNDRNTSPNKHKGTKFWLKISAFVLLFLIGLIYVAFYLIPSWLHVDEVEIPEGLIGMEYQEASETLLELNLEVDEEFRNDDDIEKDHVISHRPEEGERVKVGTRVTLFVSEGVEPIDMVSVIGQTRERAEVSLAAFEGVEIQIQETNQYDDDTVIEQSPSPGDSVIPRETMVTLTVSERPTYIMSNLYGMSRQEVIDSISNNPLLTYEFDDEYHPTMEEDRVISQTPNRGSEIRDRTTVKVVFSKGPEPEEEIEEEEPVTVNLPFNVEINGSDDDEEKEKYRVRISVIDRNNSTPRQIINEQISESRTFNVPMTLGPDDTGYLILNIDGEEYEESPYQFTFEQLKQYQ